MESVAVSRRNYSKKGNKENTQPLHGIKSVKKDANKTSTVAPFQMQGNEKERTTKKDGVCKERAKQDDIQVHTGQTVRKMKTIQRVEKQVSVRPQTCSQIFLSSQAVRNRKHVAEAPKPPATTYSSKSAPGMYKGKIIQSKIGSIWKSGAAVGASEPKSLAPKMESGSGDNQSKKRSKSVADMPGRGAPEPRRAPARSKSVSDVSKPTSKPAVTRRHAVGCQSALPPTRTVPATLKVPPSKSVTTMPLKGRQAANTKPNGQMADKKVNKPPVSSAVSQYRCTMETTEERRAKLAEWLASKGKAMKRPPMSAATSAKTFQSLKPKDTDRPHPPSHTKPQAATQGPVSEMLFGGPGDDDSAAATSTSRDADPMREEAAGLGSAQHCRTSPDLLDKSAMGLLVDPQATEDDFQIVVNLCDALEAMATPSKCEDEPTHVTECNNIACTVDERCEDLMEMRPEDVLEEPAVEDVRNEMLCNGLKMEDSESDEDDDEDDDVVETTPHRDEASMVKYSVKTTPFLQSVRKTIDEASASRSRRKSNIKDLKFLTPVRRSCRIQRKSSHLPNMLLDHDPCVSSLAELVKLDDDPNAYIYRRNPALMDDLPDQDIP